MAEHFPALPGGDQNAALCNQFAITQKNHRVMQNNQACYAQTSTLSGQMTLFSMMEQEIE